MSITDNLFSSDNAPIDTVVAAASLPFLSNLSDAIKACAPQADLARWVPVFEESFTKSSANTPQRCAAALGQFSVEAGGGFHELIENTNYTTPARLCQIFPHEFQSLEEAQACAGNPEKIANRAYANRNGNGDEASGDGFRYRGRGMIQLTGKTEYQAFAAAQSMSVEDAAEYAATDAGAVASGLWYLDWRGAWTYADSWQIDRVTRLVNGSGMMDAAKRLANSNAALAAFGV